MILLSEKEPVSAKKLAFSLGVSEKTVQKYTAQLKIILEGHGAQLITRQRVGSNIEITDQALFKQFMNRYNSNSFLDDPMTRKRYVLTRLITTDEYISIVERQIKCTKKIKLNAKRNNAKFKCIQII